MRHGAGGRRVGRRATGAGYLYVKGGIVSPRRALPRRSMLGRHGTVGGSGVGVVVLKRLTDALADRDHIRAVVKGSAINNDGPAKVGYTAPSQRGQARAIKAALTAAEVEPHTVGYIEAHGTGTALGDPIEIAALANGVTQARLRAPARSDRSSPTRATWMRPRGSPGSSRPSCASSIRQIVPTVNFETPNPELDLDSSPFRISSSLSSWPAAATPRRAAVSAFGIGGTNAHVVLEEAPPREQQTAVLNERPQLLVFSARRDEALDDMASRLADRLEEQPGLALPDVAFTLQQGRSAFDRRRALVCGTTQEAVAALRSRQWIGGPDGATRELPVIFLFPGQGGRLAGAGQELREAFPGFCRRRG